MEVRQLQIFRILAEELNFTRTAEKVHTVQSNVTSQIRSLEEELGVPLFDRLGRRVTLTDAGRRFQPLRKRPLPPWSRASASSRRARNRAGHSGSARLRASLPTVCRRFCDISPAVSPRRAQLPAPFE